LLLLRLAINVIYFSLLAESIIVLLDCSRQKRTLTLFGQKTGYQHYINQQRLPYYYFINFFDAAKSYTQNIPEVVGFYYLNERIKSAVKPQQKFFGNVFGGIRIDKSTHLTKCI